MKADRIFGLHRYSDRTRCPACKTRVDLERVRIMQSFSCPGCGAELCVSAGYLRMTRIGSFILAWLLPVASGARNILVIFILSVPLYGVILALLVYVGKHIIPPNVVYQSRSSGSTLGLQDPGEAKPK